MAVKPKQPVPPEAPPKQPLRPEAPSSPARPKKPRGPAKRPRTSKGKKPPVPAVPLRHRALYLGLEIAGLLTAALVLTLFALGEAAARFGGREFWSNLLPFAAAILALALMGAAGLWSWLHGRRRLMELQPWLATAVSLGLAAGAGWFAVQKDFHLQLANLRVLVGGMAEAERATLSHQVYAAYRRSDLAQTQRLLERAAPFLPAIQAAAKSHGLDLDVLVGVAAAESSFLPRDSADGGKGLFQITQIPKAVADKARLRLGEPKLDDPAHNAYLGAATLRHYLAEMHGDLFLGLLAYNIGPRNGGLLSIMEQYGARDFATIQPYLQNLPRDYPIRVLTAALAYRLWRSEGRLPRYEEGNNAKHIQNVGVPGLT